MQKAELWKAPVLEGPSSERNKFQKGISSRKEQVPEMQSCRNTELQKAELWKAPVLEGASSVRNKLKNCRNANSLKVQVLEDPSSGKTKLWNLKAMTLKAISFRCHLEQWFSTLETLWPAQK